MQLSPNPCGTSSSSITRQTSTVALPVTEYIETGDSVAATTLKRNREEDGSGEVSSATQQSSKRTRTIGRAAICVNCGTPFNIGDNKSCIYHDDVLMEDRTGDFFADHDEDCHGRIDDDSTEAEYPEGHQWVCCEQPGNV
jgi:hypothetical protein